MADSAEGEQLQERIWREVDIGEYRRLSIGIFEAGARVISSVFAVIAKRTSV